MKTSQRAKVLCFLAFATFVTASVRQSGAQAPVSMPDLAQAITNESNKARAANGLPPLAVEVTLMNAAWAHSEEMARLGYFAHESPTPGMTRPQERIRLAQGTETEIGENIYKLSTDKTDVTLLAQKCVDAWLNSPPHRKNLLNPSYNRVGLGVALLGRDHLVTQEFAREAIELDLLDFDQQGNTWQLDITFHVVDGPLAGDLWFEGQPIAKWQSGGMGQKVSLSLTLPRPGILQIGQRQQGGTKESIPCEIALWSEPQHFDVDQMPILPAYKD